MSIKSWIINKLKKYVGATAEHIKLENLTDEESKKTFAFKFKKDYWSQLSGTKRIEGDSKESDIRKKKWELSDETKSPIREDQQFNGEEDIILKRLVSQLSGTKRIGPRN